MFGIILPINFNSPYKSTSIIDFWRRWHMTLSRFLKDYLYIGLGGNRKGKSRRHINLLATMLLGGLWHGAAWTFVVWGGLHGLYLIINHAWRSACSHYGLSHLTDKTAYKTAGVILTTIAVLLAWVYFRSTDIDAANRVILAMFGFGEAGLSSGYGKFIAHNGFSTFIGLVSEQSAFQLTALVTIMIATQLFILLTPNAAQLLQIIEGTSALRWSPNWLWAAGCGLMLSASFVGMFGFSEFIYFQF
jgi:D-alanyl-lipoteichoic acid acyltransferase DltB (MBOAT superfamily)